jgi:hypothetical protein
MSTHTPGPWAVHRDGYTITGNRAFIATCIAVPNETAANARLIAAAPDLLDALDRIRKDLQRMSDGYSADLDVMVDVARAAVAKATE